MAIEGPRRCRRNASLPNARYMELTGSCTPWFGVFRTAVDLSGRRGEMSVKQSIRRNSPPRPFLRALVFPSAAVTVVAAYVALRVIAANAMLDRVDFSTRHS